MKYYGKYRAIVTNIKDPEKMGRIKVKCPKILGDKELNWALPNLPPYMFMLPKVGDYVWIEFEEGDTEYPIWTGCFYTSALLKERFGDIYVNGDYDKKVLMNGLNGVKLKSSKKFDITSKGDLEILSDTKGEFISKTDLNLKSINSEVTLSNSSKSVNVTALKEHLENDKDLVIGNE